MGYENPRVIGSTDHSKLCTYIFEICKYVLRPGMCGETVRYLAPGCRCHAGAEHRFPKATVPLSSPFQPGLTRSHGTRANKSRFLIFLREPWTLGFSGAWVPTFKSINFRAKTTPGLMGNSRGLEMMDSFSLQNENLMHSLTKEDDFTPSSLYFLPGWWVPLFPHTRVNVEFRNACLSEWYHYTETLCTAPPTATLLPTMSLAPQCLTSLGIKALKGTLLWLFIHRISRLSPEWNTT